MRGTISRFVDDKNIALIGVSKDKTKFGNILVKELTNKGYTVFPVHPELKEIEGKKCFPSLDDLPQNVENLLLVVKPKATEEIVSSLNPLKIRRIWMHKGMGSGSSTLQAIEICRNKEIGVVYGFCPMMFLSNSGIHRFHKWMRETLGKTPKEYKEDRQCICIETSN